MLTSQTLLSRVKKDDQVAWTRFVHLYAELVYQWCRTAGLQADDAADVSQEVFQIVSIKIRQFDPSRKPSGAFRSWLWGITRLEILDHFRRAARNQQPAGGSQVHMMMQRLEDSTDEPPGSHGITSQQLLLRKALDMLESEFEPTTWRAFWRMTIDGDPAREIAGDIGMTPRAVRQAKYRVICKLREYLEDELPDQ